RSVGFGCGNGGSSNWTATGNCALQDQRPVRAPRRSRRRRRLSWHGEISDSIPVMRRVYFIFLCSSVAAFQSVAQGAVDVPRAEEKQKQQNAVAKAQEKRAQATATVEFTGEQAFTEKDLRSAVKEQLTTLDQFGLTSARADDLAFFIEVFYRKHGYTKATVRYKIENRDGLLMEINEGPLMSLGTITFQGNEREPTKKL